MSSDSATGARDLWARLAEATRPLQPPGVDRRAALGLVVSAVDRAREAGVQTAEMGHVRGLALHALSAGGREPMLSAMARIYSTSIVERAKLGS